MHKGKMSTEQVQQVIAMFKATDKPNLSEIGRSLGFRSQSVKYQLIKHGLILDDEAPVRGEVHAMSDQDIAEAVRMHEAGTTLGNIVKALGFSIETVRRRLMETGHYRTIGRGRPTGCESKGKVDRVASIPDRDPGAPNPMMLDWASRPLLARAA